MKSQVEVFHKQTNIQFHYLKINILGLKEGTLERKIFFIWLIRIIK
jgi:hypothetical protein